MPIILTTTVYIYIYIYIYIWLLHNLPVFWRLRPTWDERKKREKLITICFPALIEKHETVFLQTQEVLHTAQKSLSSWWWMKGQQTHRCLVTPLSRNGKGWHRHYRIWGQMRTGRISHASAHSCEGQASATTAHRLHEENLYDRQPTERKHEEKRKGRVNEDYNIVQ